jgi:hypothetical protein
VQLIETAPVNRQAATTNRIISRTATADATATEGAYGGRSPKWWAFGYKRAQNKFVELVLPILNACTFGVYKLAPPTAERHTRKLTSTDVRTDPRFSPASESMV